MDFQIEPLAAEQFTHLFQMSDADLAHHQARRQTVTESPGIPCRVSLQDAQIGETVILCNYMHQPNDSPYRASHAVFVREAAQEARIAVKVIHSGGIAPVNLVSI